MNATAIVLLSVSGVVLVLCLGALFGYMVAEIRNLRRQLDRANPRLSYDDLADALDKPSPDAARMAVKRALVRLAKVMDDENR